MILMQDVVIKSVGKIFPGLSSAPSHSPFIIC